MSMKVGLGACQEDLEVQGEIDFDFFEKEENHVVSVDEVANNSKYVEIAPTSSEQSLQNDHISTTEMPSEENSSVSSCKPKVCFEAIIPSPDDSCQELNNNDEDDLIVDPLCLKESDDKCGDLSNSPLSSASSSMSDLSSSSTSCDLTDEGDSFEETDSMTDVTPLSSKCHSPMILPKEDAEGGFKVDQKYLKEQMSPSKDLQNNNKSILQRPFKMNHLMRTLKELQLDQNKSIPTVVKPKIIPTPLAETNDNKHRKNPTFTNEEARKIDQDNQRLLKKILAQQNRPKPTIIPLHTRPSSSSINRQRQQRQIELDNMALLQRLEAAKPSKDLNRSRLLTEYKRRPGTCTSFRSVSPSSKSISTSCRSSAQKSGRSSVITIPISNKAAKHH